MDHIIQQIIELDKSARDILRQAQDENQKKLETLDKKKQDIRQKYYDRAQKRIEDIKKQEDAYRQSEFQKLDTQHQDELVNLGQLFGEKRQWLEDELFHRCIGR